MNIQLINNTNSNRRLKYAPFTFRYGNKNVFKDKSSANNSNRTIKNDAIPITKEYLWDIVSRFFAIGAFAYSDSSPLIVSKNHFAIKTMTIPRVKIIAKPK
jgi:hypothetical protein